MKIWARRLRKFLELFPQQIHNSIGRNYDVKCRVAEQGRIAAKAAMALSVMAGSVTPLKSTISENWGLKSGSEAIRLWWLSKFSVRDPAVKCRVHNFTLGVDF